MPWWWWPRPSATSATCRPGRSRHSASADVIYCEDTRHSRKLLTHAGISGVPLRSLHEHNEADRVDEVVAAVAAGRTVALVSDAGMPGVSDPGARVTAAVAAAGLTVTVVPGPSAVLAALVASGLATDRFCFEGFLPRSGRERAERLAVVAAEPRTTVLFEAPGRVAATLADLAGACGGDRAVAVARELTKLHEEVWRGTLDGAAARAADGVRGEVVLVLAGAPAADVTEVTDEVLAADLADRAGRRGPHPGCGRRGGGPPRRAAAAGLRAGPPPARGRRRGRSRGRRGRSRGRRGSAGRTRPDGRGHDAGGHVIRLTPALHLRAGARRTGRRRCHGPPSASPGEVSGPARPGRYAGGQCPATSSPRRSTTSRTRPTSGTPTRRSTPTPWRGGTGWWATTSSSSPAPTSTARRWPGPPRSRASPPRSGPTGSRRASPRPGPGLDIAPDDFIRTTEARHTVAVQEFLSRIHDNGFIYKDTYRGLYCVACERYYAPDELLPGGLCPDHRTVVEELEEENYFFRLSAFQQRLIDWYSADPDVVVPEPKRNEALSFIKGGLNDISITRTSIDWGVRVPWDDDHVFYVWYDALINYVTAIGYGQDQERFDAWWPHVHHLIGKEIVRFHCVWWPAMCMAAGIDPPAQVQVHGWLLLGGAQDVQLERQPHRTGRPGRGVRRRSAPLPPAARRAAGQ